MTIRESTSLQKDLLTFKTCPCQITLTIIQIYQLNEKISMNSTVVSVCTNYLLRQTEEQIVHSCTIIRFKFKLISIMALCNFDKSNSLWFDKEVNYLIILLTRLVSLKFSEFVNHHFNYQEDDQRFWGKTVSNSIQSKRLQRLREFKKIFLQNTIFTIFIT